MGKGISYMVTGEIMFGGEHTIEHTEEQTTMAGNICNV